MKIIFTFPGQGNQRPDMLAALPDRQNILAEARTVRWQEAMIAADERDARLAIEMPPGGVLTCLTRQAGWQGECIALERSGIDVARHLANRLNG